MMINLRSKVQGDQKKYLSVYFRLRCACILLKYDEIFVYLASRVIHQIKKAATKCSRFLEMSYSGVLFHNKLNGRKTLPISNFQVINAWCK